MNATIITPTSASSISTTGPFMSATITPTSASSISTTGPFMSATITPTSADFTSTINPFVITNITPSAAGYYPFMSATITPPSAGSTSTTDHFMNATITPPPAASSTSTNDPFMNTTITEPAASSTPETDALRDITFDINLPSPIDFEEVQSSIVVSSGILENSDIQRIKRISCSRKNFASRLVRELFDETTRRKSNVKGKLGKLQLNPVLIDYVKSITFQYYPLEQFEKENEEWADCIIPIDEANRRKPKLKKRARQN